MKFYTRQPGYAEKYGQKIAALVEVDLMKKPLTVAQIGRRIGYSARTVQRGLVVLRARGAVMCLSMPRAEMVCELCTPSHASSAPLQKIDP